MTDRTTIGDRMKAYEEPSTTRRAFKGQPLVVRLDGKNFHTYTKGMKRPYDEALSTLMKKTMMELVDRFNATVGYCQSDEITLIWLTTPDSTVDLPFSGRFQKLESLLAGFCSAYFAREATKIFPEKDHLVPYFDARAFVVPTALEAYHAVLWRQQDCTKNAISMAAQSMFSHKELLCRTGPEMQEMMWKTHGVNFNDYPAFFKRGVFARRVKEERVLSPERLANIPEAHRPKPTHYVRGTGGPRSSEKNFETWSKIDALFQSSDRVHIDDLRKAAKDHQDPGGGENFIKNHCERLGWIVAEPAKMLRSFIDEVDIWLTKQPDPMAALFYGAKIVQAPNPPIPEGEIKKGIRGRAQELLSQDWPE